MEHGRPPQDRLARVKLRDRSERGGSVKRFDPPEHLLLKGRAPAGAPSRKDHASLKSSSSSPSARVTRSIIFKVLPDMLSYRARYATGRGSPACLEASRGWATNLDPYSFSRCPGQLSANQRSRVCRGQALPFPKVARTVSPKFPAVTTCGVLRAIQVGDIVQNSSRGVPTLPSQRTPAARLTGDV